MPPKRKHRVHRKKHNVPLFSDPAPQIPYTMAINFMGDMETNPAASPAAAPAAPAAKSTSMSSKTKKNLGIAGGVVGGALAVAGAGYYAWKAYETGGESLYHDEEPHISVPNADPDPVAGGLNSAVDGMRNW